jgi:hypothetical protein
MLSGVALIAAPSYLVDGPGRNFTGAWEFVAVVLVLIALVFVRVYVLGDWFRRRAAHRSGQRAAHSASRVPERDGNHGHRATSRRRQNRP